MSQTSMAEEENPSHFPKDTQTPEAKMKGASVQEVKGNVPSGSRAIVPSPHNTNEGSGSKNEEQMWGDTIPPSEHTNKVNTQAEHVVPEPKKEHLNEASASDPAKSQITAYQSVDINPALKEEPEVIQRPSGTQPDDVQIHLGTVKEVSKRVKKSLGDALCSHVHMCSESVKDQPDDAKRAAQKQVDNVQRPSGAEIKQPDDVSRSVETATENSAEVQGFKGLSKEQADDVDRALETGKVEQGDNTGTPAAKEQSDEIKVGSLKNVSPGSSEPQPVSSLQHEPTPDSLPDTTEDPSALSEESILLEKIRQMAEDSDIDTSPLFIPVPALSRRRKRLVPFQSDFDLTPSPPLNHRVCTTSPELGGQLTLHVSEVTGMNDLQMAVTSEEPTVEASELHTDETEMCKDQNTMACVLEDERKETLNSETNDETLGGRKVLADRVSAKDELNESQIETLRSAPVQDHL